MLWAFLVAAIVIAVLIVGPANALAGMGMRVVQLGGVVIAAGIAWYVLPVLLGVAALLVAFGLLVFLFTSFFRPSN